MSILEPRTTLSITPASQTVGVLEQRVLFVGQMLDTGTATAGTLVEDIPSDGSENTYFGQGSHLATMIKDYKTINPATNIDAICLADDESAGTATCVITVSSGTVATEAKSVNISVASEYKYTVEVDLSIGDTATEIGDAIVAKFDNLADAPFSAVNNAGVVTFSANNGGSHANDWCVKVDGTVAGVTMTLTGWAGGVNDPDTTNILDLIDNIRYRTVVYPSCYSLADIEALLNARFNANYEVLIAANWAEIQSGISMMAAPLRSLSSTVLLGIITTLWLFWLAYAFTSAAVPGYV